MTTVTVMAGLVTMEEDQIRVLAVRVVDLVEIVMVVEGVFLMVGEGDMEAGSILLLPMVGAFGGYGGKYSEPQLLGSNMHFII